MRRWNGYALALLGFLILVGSLVVSSPFSGHGEGRRVRECAPGPVPKEAGPAPGTFPIPDPGGSVATHGTPLQETGPIVFRGEELDAHLTFPVPSGGRFVIESFSVRAVLGGGSRGSVMFTATSRGVAATHVVPLEVQGSFPSQGDVLAGQRAFRVYADGGSVIHVQIDRTSARESDSGFVTLSGFLE